MSKPNKPQPKVLGQEDVKRWLVAFQNAVNAMEPLTLEKLFHPKTIGFEAGHQSTNSIASVLMLHWKNLCSSSQHTFAFLMADARVMPSLDMFAIAIKYMTTRKIVGCEPEFGQATFVLCDFEGKLLGVHSHISLCPG